MPASWSRTPVARYGALVLLIAAAFFLISAQRDVAFWDTGEMQTVPWILGIAHPTGFPAFVLLGWCFAHLLPLGSVAWRLAAFTSLAGAIATLALYAVAARATHSPALAAGAALIFATSESVWEHATRAEVHVLALCFSTVAFFAFDRWRRAGTVTALAAGAGAAGLALATHPVAIWTLPGLVVLITARRPQLRLALASGASFVLMALLPYAYMPVRSASLFAMRRDPTLALGFDAGMPFWDYAHPAVAQNFWWLVLGRQFDKHDGFAAYFNPMQLVTTARTFAGFEWHQVGALELFAIAGAVFVLLCDRRFGIALLLFGLAGVPFALGYSLEADQPRYLLDAQWTVALLGAAGIAWPAAEIGKRWRAHVWFVRAISLVLLVAVAANAYRNRNVFAIDRDGVPRAFVARVEQTSSSDAIVVAPWVYATPLAYAAYVERSFGQRVVVAGDATELAPRIVMWSQSRCVIVVSDRGALSLAGVRLSPSRTALAPYVFVAGSASSRCSGAEGTPTTSRSER